MQRMKENEIGNVDLVYRDLHINSKNQIISLQGIFAAFLYGICSMSMAFINKAAVTSYKFHFPFFIMACQMMLCIFVFELSRILKLTNIPKYSLKLGKSFAWPAAFYAIHSVTALTALEGMSIPMYGAVKRCSPIMILFLSIVVFKKPLPSISIISSVFMMSIGCVLAGAGDLQFEAKAYSFGVISALVQGLYLTLSQKSMEKMSALDVLYISSYNTILFFIIVFLMTEIDGVRKFEGHSDIGFIYCFLLQTSMGILLNYSLFLCTEKNSALLTSLVGVFKSILQTVVGFFAFGGVPFTLLNFGGITLNLLGGIMYSHTKFIEKRPAPIESKV